MIDKKIVDAASNAAATHMQKLLTSVHSEESLNTTVYFEAYNQLVNSTELSRDDIKARIEAWVKTQYDPNNHHLVASIVGNIMKYSENPNMSSKAFRKLIKALFPA